MEVSHTPVDIPTPRDAWTALKVDKPTPRDAWTALKVDKPTPRDAWTALKDLPQRVATLLKKYESSNAGGFEDFERELHALFAQTECAVTEEALARHDVDLPHVFIDGDGYRRACRCAQAAAQFKKYRHLLRHEPDGVNSVIRALLYLRSKYPGNERIAQVLGYFRGNRHRMRYADAKARGLPIGSGVVEAACKTLVTERLKLVFDSIVGSAEANI